MADSEEQTNPVEQLVELLVYAPIGLLYEYEDVLPKLVRRGKSQVQLARVLGQMAVKSRQNDPAAVVGDVAGLAATAITKALTDIGAQVGLAPTGEDDATADEAPTKTPGSGAGAPGASAGAPKATPDAEAPASGNAAGAGDIDDEASEPAPVDAPPLPIAGYDDLTARQIIALLDELTPAQRERIRAHEAAGRNRKTVLAKLDRLDQ